MVIQFFIPDNQMFVTSEFSDDFVGLIHLVIQVRFTFHNVLSLFE
jgi:hypothetical protein